MALSASTQAFIKYAHKKPGLRGGISDSKIITNWQKLPTILKELARSHIYKSVLMVNSFPKNFPEYRTLPRLADSSIESEFVWTATILGINSTSINEFIKLRDLFYQDFSHGKYEIAEQTLNTIENKFGLSLWLLSRRIQLIQLKHGLKAQKDYLESILSQKGLNTWAAWLSYYFSLRSEENISYAALNSELTEIIESSNGISDFILYHIIPYRTSEIKSPKSIINQMEPCPIIDRYETWVAMFQLVMARLDGSIPSYLIASLDEIKEIQDRSLDNCRILANKDKLTSNVSEVIKNFDNYAAGKYDTDISKFFTVELSARSRAHLELSEKSFQTGSIYEQTVMSMREVLLLGSGYKSAILHLKKLSLIFAGMPISTEIAAFVERTHDNIQVPHYSQLDRLATLKGISDNPWHVRCLNSFTENFNYLDKLLEIQPESIILQLIDSLDLNLDVGCLKIDNLAIPNYRKSLYKGHLSYINRDFSKAITHYTNAAREDGQFTNGRAQAYLFKATLDDGDIKSAVSIAAMHCLNNSNAFRVYPLVELINAAMKFDNLLKSHELAILVQLASRNIHPKWERDLSDIYERILIAAGVGRPSEILHISGPNASKQLIYFLRHICIPRVMDDSIEFESIEEIEDERLLLCQMLSAIDVENVQIYSDEIKAITREATIYKLLKKVESSKIYVDEDGIYSTLKDTLEAAFLRYQLLLNNPSASYQSQKITKIIGELLGENAPPDLKNIKIPSSELESLFAKILLDFVAEFALNPAYGLDTHLSTTIRHGAFEGHLRTPLGKEDILLRKDKFTQKFIFPARWINEIGDDVDALDFATSTLENFTQAIELLISNFHKDSLRINTDQNPAGMFDFELGSEESLALMQSITEKTTYDELISRLFSYCWKSTENSLSNIRISLQADFLNQLNNEIDKASDAILTSHFSEKLKPLNDALVMGRTGLQSAVDKVCDWFHLPRDLAREPFELELAVDVAIMQIHNCYVKSKISPIRDLNIQNMIPGRHLDGIVEVLFILLQNIILRGGNSEEVSTVTIRCNELNCGLEIVIENTLSSEIDIEERKLLASEAVERYQRDTALRLARQEGGSGLSKVWRICEHDMRKDHSLNLEIFDNRIFRATVWISDIWE